MAIVSTGVQGHDLHVKATQVDERGCVLTIWVRPAYDAERIPTTQLVVDLAELDALTTAIDLARQSVADLQAAKEQTG